MANEHRRVTLTAEAMDKLRKVSCATLTTQLLGRGFRNTFIRGLMPMRPDLRMVGYAYTLRYVPSREDVGNPLVYDNTKNPQRIAVEAVGPDDVLVIDARGEVSAASFGHIIATRTMMRGAAGIVTDGALRDTPLFRELKYPTYCRAAHATTSSVAHHPVDLNVPIGCGGVLVLPGDVIVGDAEGVVVIPAQVAEEVAHATWEQDQLEDFILKKVESGSSILGVYPPTDEIKKEYQEWRKRGGG